MYVTQEYYRLFYQKENTHEGMEEVVATADSDALWGWHLQSSLALTNRNFFLSSVTFGPAYTKEQLIHT